MSYFFLFYIKFNDLPYLFAWYKKRKIIYLSMLRSDPSYLVYLSFFFILSTEFDFHWTQNWVHRSVAWKVFRWTGDRWIRYKMTVFQSCRLWWKWSWALDFTSIKLAGEFGAAQWALFNSAFGHFPAGIRSMSGCYHTVLLDSESIEVSLGRCKLTPSRGLTLAPIPFMVMDICH